MDMTLEGLAKEIQKLSIHTETMIDNLAGVMAAEFARVHERFEGVDNRFDAVDARFESVDGEFVGINTRFDRLEKRMMRVEELCEDHSGRFISLEDQVAKVQYTIDEANPRDLKRRIEKLELRAA